MGWILHPHPLFKPGLRQVVMSISPEPKCANLLRKRKGPWVSLHRSTGCLCPQGGSAAATFNGTPLGQKPRMDPPQPSSSLSAWASTCPQGAPIWGQAQTCREEKTRKMEGGQNKHVKDNRTGHSQWKSSTEKTPEVSKPPPASEKRPKADREEVRQSLRKDNQFISF